MMPASGAESRESMALGPASPFPPSAASSGVSSPEFREALSKVTAAVTIVTTDGPAGRAGVTCSAVCSVSDAPPTIVACVHRESAANRIIKANGVLCVNCLHADQQPLSQIFAGAGCVPMAERFADGRWAALTTGAPCCTDAMVALDCEVLEIREIGTHSLFVAKVLLTAHAGPAEPLIYHRRAYATTRSL